MTHEQAMKVMPLAPRNIEVLEKLDLQCFQCLGHPSTPPCPVCNSTGQTKWNWTPRVGEWCISPVGKTFLIDSDNLEYTTSVYKDCIPILEWETIQTILEKAGYWFDIDDLNFGYRIGICNTSGELLVEKEAKTRQKAVMLAIDALGKGLEK